MSDTSIREYVSGHSFFSGMRASDLDAVVKEAQERRAGRGEVLFHQGERAEKFYLIKSGAVSVQIPAITGPTLEIQSLGAGKILGWSWLIAPYRWSFQARVTEDAEIVEFDGATLRERCEEDPRLGYELMKRFAGLMSERLDAARRTMIEEWNPPGFA